MSQQDANQGDRLGMDIVRAISLDEGQGRVGALRRLASLLDSDAVASDASTPLDTRSTRSRSAPADMRALRKIDALAQMRPLGELDIMAFVDCGEPACAIATLAQLARLPIATAQRLFSMQRPDFLLIVCRAQCFAWSTTERLLMMMDQVTLDRPQILSLCDEYHDMPIAMAQRFGRFLCAHFPPDRSKLS